MDDGNVHTGSQLRAKIAVLDRPIWEVASASGCHPNYLMLMLRGRKALTPVWRDRIEAAIHTLLKRSGEPA